MKKEGRGRLILAGAALLLLVGALTAAGIRRPPDPALALCEQAEAEARRGDVTAAALHYNRAMALSPRNPRPYIGLAVLYETVERPDLAVVALEQLQAVDPQAEHLGCRLTEAHLGVEEVRRARALGEAAVRREPNCARALTNYGIALIRSRQWQTATEMLRRAQALAPEDPGIGETLVDVQVQGGAFREAAELGETLLRRFPQSPKLEFQTGLAWSQLIPQPGAAERALAHFRRTAELAPDWFEPHAELGRLYQSLERTAPAIAAYEQAWKIRPGSPGVAYNLALLWRRQGDPRGTELQQRLPGLSKAAGRLDLLRMRCYQEPTNVANILATAELEAELGRYGVALFRLRNVLTTDPADTRVLAAYQRIDARSRAGYPNYLRPGPGVVGL